MLLLGILLFCAFVKLNRGMIHHQKPAAINDAIEICSITFLGAKRLLNENKV